MTVRLFFFLSAVCLCCNSGAAQERSLSLNSSGRPPASAVSGSVPASDGKLGSTMTLRQLQQSRDKLQGVHNKPIKKSEPPEKPIDVQPAAEPTPALRLTLYPAKRQLKPGQALLHFTRGLLLYSQMSKEQQNLWQSKEWLQRQGNGAIPTAEELKAAVAPLEHVFDELHELAMSEDFKWDHRIRDLRGPAVFGYLLPDVQEARALAKMLKLKIRHQLNEQDFDGAVSSISDGLRLAEFVGQGETLIQKLVGIALCNMMWDSLTEAISTPGCPNLYWALATIPRPLVRVKESVLWELGNTADLLPVLAEAEQRVWTEAEADQKWLDMLNQLSDLTGSLSPGNSDRIALAVASVGMAETARERLLSRGMTQQQLRRLPNIQILIIDAAREVRRVGDDLGKSFLLPSSAGKSLLRKDNERFQAWVKDNRSSSLAAVIAGLIYPAVVRVNEAETRSLMIYNRLMTLEALRMHAAEHNGQLPESLDQLSPVPAMFDAYSDQPFEYHVEVSDGHQVVRLKAAGPADHKPMQELRVRF